jgi:hypothetical protein
VPTAQYQSVRLERNISGDSFRCSRLTIFRSTKRARAAIQEILRLHNLSDAQASENQVGSILKMKSAPGFALVDSAYGLIPARGTQGGNGLRRTTIRRYRPISICCRTRSLPRQLCFHEQFFATDRTQQSDERRRWENGHRELGTQASAVTGQTSEIDDPTVPSFSSLRKHARGRAVPRAFLSGRAPASKDGTGPASQSATSSHPRARPSVFPRVLRWRSLPAKYSLLPILRTDRPP